MSDGLKLIASILEHNSTQVFRQLEDELFEEDELGVYRYVKSHFRRYGEFPVFETVESECSVELPEVPEHLDYYFNNVRHRRIYKLFKQEWPNVRSAIAEGTDAFDELNASTQRLARICRVHAPQQDLLELADLSDSIREDILRNRLSCGLTGIPTGWSHLDEQSGGYQPGDLIVLSARPGVGKTSIALHSALNSIDSGYSCLVVTMEMTAKQMAIRAAAQICGVNPYFIRTGRLSYYAERRLSRALDSLDAMRGFRLYAGNFKKTTDDLDMVIKEVRPDYVIIDGIYIMSPSADKRFRSNNRYEKVAEVADDVKRIALMNNVPIFATTQFNREAGKKGSKGTMENIGFTDAFSQHASILLSLSKGRKSLKTINLIDEDSEDGSVVNVKTITQYPTRIIELLKGREGEEGKFTINYKFAPVDFSQIADEDEISETGEANVDVGYMI